MVKSKTGKYFKYAIGEILDKRWYQIGTPIYLSLIFSVLITSCNWQDKTNVTQDSIVESK